MHRRRHAFLQSVLSIQSASPAATIQLRDRPFSHSKENQSTLQWFWPSSWLILLLLILFGLLIMGLLIGVLFTVPQFRQQQHHLHDCASPTQRRSLSSYLKFIERRKNVKKMRRAKIWYPETVISNHGGGASKPLAGRAFYEHIEHSKQVTMRKLSDINRDTEKTPLQHYLSEDPRLYNKESTKTTSIQTFNYSKCTSLSSFAPLKSTVGPTPPNDILINEPHPEIFHSAVNVQRACSFSPIGRCDTDSNRTIRGEVQCPLASSQTSLLNGYDGSASTMSTGMSGSISDTGPTSDVFPPTDSNSWYFYRIAKLLSDGDGLGDFSGISSVQHSSTNHSKSDPVQQLLSHIVQSDPHPCAPQTDPLDTLVQPPADIRQPSLYRILEMKIPETGENLLHLASKWNRPAAVLALLDVGADPTNVDLSGRTALLTAVCSGAIESIHTILTHPVAGSNPMCFVPSLLTDSTTPLMQAVKLNDVESFKLILHAMNALGCSLARNDVINTVCCSGAEDNPHSTLTFTSSSGDTNVMRCADKSIIFVSPRLTQEDGAASVLDLNNSDNLGRTALHWAAATNQVECIHGLLDAGAAVDVQTIYDETPLALAAKEGCLSACRLLLTAGANPDLSDYLDRSPKTLAELNGHAELVKLFQTFQVASSPRQISVPLLNDTRLGTVHSDPTSSLIEWSLFTGACPDTNNTMMTDSRDTFLSSSSSRTTEHHSFSDGNQERSVAPNWHLLRGLADLRIPSAAHVSQFRNYLSNRTKVIERGIKQEEECRGLTTVTRSSESGSDRNLIESDYRHALANDPEPRIYSSLLVRPFSNLLFDERSNVNSTRCCEKVPENADTQFMGSDSESPNRWSSSPSDSSPKHGRSFVKSPFTSVSHLNRLPLHTVARPRELRPFATPDSTHEFQVTSR